MRYLYLARAVVEERQFTVDHYAHPSHGDLAFHNGHFYSGSPPGLGLLLAPIASLRCAIGDATPFSPNVLLQFLALALFQTPLAALTVLLVWRLLLDAGLDARRAAGAALAMGLATPFFFFTSKLSDYPITAFLSVVAARAMLALRRPPPAKSASILSPTGSALLAGACIGLAWAINDLAGILLALFVILSTLSDNPMTISTRLRRMAFFAIGVIPAVAVRLLYMRDCFGSPFANPLAFSAASISVTDEYHALGGTVQVMSAMLREFPLMIWDLTVGDVGLFVFAPVFLVLFAWRRASRAQREGNALRGTDDLLFLARAGLITFFVNAGLHIMLINGFWKGGASWGPRYLLFSIVPLTLAAAHAARGVSGRTLAALAAISAIITSFGVQYGYNTSITSAAGHFLVGGPTSPAFRWIWLHWAITPSPARIAIVLEETPRLGAYYAFTHPSPFLGFLLLGLLLTLLWLPVLRSHAASD